MNVNYKTILYFFFLYIWFQILINICLIKCENENISTEEINTENEKEKKKRKKIFFDSLKNDEGCTGSVERRLINGEKFLKILTEMKGEEIETEKKIEKETEKKGEETKTDKETETKTKTKIETETEKKGEETKTETEKKIEDEKEEKEKDNDNKKNMGTNNYFDLNKYDYISIQKYPYPRTERVIIYLFKTRNKKKQIIKNDFYKVLFDCAQASSGKPLLINMCVKKYFRKYRINFSSTCLNCFTDFIGCCFINCNSKCSLDPCSTDCRNCSNKYCLSTLLKCTKLEQLPEPCD